MGEEAMRITVMGAVLVAAMVLITFLAIQALTQGSNRDQKKDGQ